MTRTYTIHINPYNFSLLSTPNYKKIPNHASTQYAYAIEPLKPIAEKTHTGFAPRPNVQRKATKDARPLNAAQITVAPTYVQKTKKKRAKFRKNINKEALAKYFDNEKQATAQQWLATVVAELEQRDIIARKNQFDLQQDIEQRYALFDIIKYFDYANATMDEANAVNITNIKIITMPQPEIEQIKAIAAHFAAQLQQVKMSYSIHSNPEFHDKQDFTPAAKSERMSDTPKINEFIADRFVNKYHGADTSAAMRAFEKQKRHSTKAADIMYNFQKTK